MTYRAPGLAEIARFPQLVSGIEQISETALIVRLADGTESRLMKNSKRGFVVPRRWRNPR